MWRSTAVSSQKEFGDKCHLSKVLEAVSRCTDKPDEADLLVRGHYDIQVYVELAGMDIAPFSPALFTTLVVARLWQEWDRTALAHEWGAKVGPSRTPRISWADDDNICLAENEPMLRVMLREMNRLLLGCGMSLGCSDPDTCSWASADDRSPDSLMIEGTASIQQVKELRISGRVFDLRALEEATVEDRVSKA